MTTRSTYKTPVTGCPIDTITPAPTGAGGDLIQDNFVSVADALESIATDLGGKANTSSVTSALAGKADSTHTHIESDITGLSLALSGKSDTTHVHAYSTITGTPDLSGYATTAAMNAALSGYIPEPASDGSTGQVLTTDGAGGRSWTTVTSGGGTTYTAGTGITISGTTISVTAGTYASASHTHAASEITSGTLDIARIPTGTTSSTVSLGNHTHTAATISNLATVATTGSYNDLSDQPTIPTAYTLPTATASVLGGVKVGTNLSISSGVLSATNTTYSEATTSANGLMSASDKTKLDGIADSADSVAWSQSTTSGTQIATITINGTATAVYAPTSGGTGTSVMIAGTGTGSTLRDECENTANGGCSFSVGYRNEANYLYSAVIGGYYTAASREGSVCIASKNAISTQEYAVETCYNPYNMTVGGTSGVKSITTSSSSGSYVPLLTIPAGAGAVIRVQMVSPNTGDYCEILLTINASSGLTIGTATGTTGSYYNAFLYSNGVLYYTGSYNTVQLGLFYTIIGAASSEGGYGYGYY